jgi:GTPase SAR1 family protein
MTDAQIATPDAAAVRKPRIALMGEFSAGKSTLANILMRESLSPVQVTATQLPPLWYTWGEGAPIRIGVDGSETPLEHADLRGHSVADTRAVRVHVLADILEACDIIDMPGSSDPNMTVDIWEDMLPMADGVIWCTPATQAWRQSEAALWEEISDRLGRNSLLLITRFDKILSSDDRERVVRRVRKEAGSTFRNVHPVSLLAALSAGDDPERWSASGMEGVLDDLFRIVTALTESIERTPEAFATAPLARKAELRAEPRAEPRAELRAEPRAEQPTELRPAPATATPEAPARQATPETRAEVLSVQARIAPVTSTEAAAPAQIVPRRVVPRPTSATERPRARRSQGSGSFL